MNPWQILSLSGTVIRKSSPSHFQGPRAVSTQQLKFFSLTIKLQTYRKFPPCLCFRRCLLMWGARWITFSFLSFLFLSLAGQPRFSDPSGLHLKTGFRGQLLGDKGALNYLAVTVRTCQHVPWLCGFLCWPSHVPLKCPSVALLTERVRSLLGPSV